MAITDLHSVVEEMNNNEDNSLQKVQFGYVVKQYDTVLALLKSHDEYYGTYRGAVMGDDYSAIGDISFNNLNFSTNSNAALWKMEVGLFGSIPIKHTTSQKYSIVSTENYNLENIQKTGNSRSFPYALSNSALNGSGVWGAKDNFECGVYIDVADNLFKYFDTFYNRHTEMDGKFTQKSVADLAYNKLLTAQIISQDGSVNCEAKIIGKTPVDNNSRILFSPTLFATSAIKRLKVPVKISGGGKTFEVFSDTTGVNCVSAMKSYSYDQRYAKIDGLDKSFWDDILNNAVDTSENDELPDGKILQPPKTNVFVKIFISQNDREAASKFLPKGVTENIFMKYNTTRIGNTDRDIHRDASWGADVVKMMECITKAADAAGCIQYTKDDIRQVDSLQGVGMNAGHPAWYQVGNLPTDKAMAGSFTIPTGWPIGITLRKRDSVARLKEKGHPYAGDSKWGNSWAIAHTTHGGNPDERFDPELEKPLTGQIMSGNMPREWYQERIRRAELGDVEVRCNKNVANAWHNVFVETKRVFQAAVTLYNDGKPMEQQISVPEMLLRCAPALCALNGSGPLGGCHRWGQSTAHGRGAALDFDPKNNNIKSSKSDHLKTEIASKIDCAYRPFIHFVYKYGGGWGGSYRFQGGTGPRNFDGMHFQMSNYSTSYSKLPSN